VLAVGSLFVFRKRQGWQKLPAVNFLYPLIPISYVLVGTLMIVWGVIYQPKPSLAALGTIALGIAVHHTMRRNASAA
jgi:basic amino acid/polyamine antiporter, APA family